MKICLRFSCTVILLFGEVAAKLPFVSCPPPVARNLLLDPNCAVAGSPPMDAVLRGAGAVFGGAVPILCVALQGQAMISIAFARG